MSEYIRAAKPILLVVVTLAVVSGLALAGFGVWLVYLGSAGEATIQLFGQDIKTTMAGIPAIFIGAVMIAVILRYALHTTTNLGGLESKTLVLSDGMTIGDRTRKKLDDKIVFALEDASLWDGNRPMTGAGDRAVRTDELMEHFECSKDEIESSLGRLLDQGRVVRDSGNLSDPRPRWRTARKF